MHERTRVIARYSHSGLQMVFGLYSSTQILTIQLRKHQRKLTGNGREYKITPQEKEELSLVPKINREENEVHGLFYFFQNATAVKKQLSQRVVHLVM